MRPGANHNAVSVSVLARLLQSREGIQIALHVVVVPAANGEYRHADAIDIFAHTQISSRTNRKWDVPAIV